MLISNINKILGQGNC